MRKKNIYFCKKSVCEAKLTQFIGNKKICEGLKALGIIHNNFQVWI